MTPATNAWTGATINTIEPAPGVDGRAFIGYKVTNPSAGVTMSTPFIIRIFIARFNLSLSLSAIRNYGQ